MSDGSPGLTLIHYEVYALQGGRWVLHARYRREERDTALEEARRIETGLGIASKVIREVYYPQENNSEEATIYVSDKARQMRAAYRAPGGGQDWARSDGTEPRPRGAKPANGILRGIGIVDRGTIVVVSKLSAILAGSIIGAALFAAILSVALTSFPSPHTYFLIQNLSAVQVVSFIVAFLVLAIPLSMKKVAWHGFAAEPRMGLREGAPRPVAPFGGNAYLSGERASANEPPPAREEEAPAPEEPAKEPEPWDAQRTTLLRFVDSLLEEVAHSQPELDAYNRFGLSLMLAGAAGVLGERRNLPDATRRLLLEDALRVTGTKADTAMVFAAKYEDYLLEQRYLPMIQAGRQCMEDFLDDKDSGVGSARALFDAWNQPKPQQSKSGTTTVMFTDMVGSTDLTQAQGDAWAYDVLRRHNGIVRACLVQCGGKEIKHTGDGIMAAFPSAVTGVEAAIAIQRAVSEHNARAPEHALHLRIGLNAGEPIVEDDDLFGTMVQLASRVCGFADQDQVICTNVVRELSAGKDFVFAPLGEQILKGFPKSQPLFEVIWRPAASGSSGEASPGVARAG